MKQTKTRISKDSKRGFVLKPGEIKIFNALTNHEDGLTFKELMNITELSHTALAQYLKRQLQAGVVRKDYKKRKYRLARIYLPIENFPNKWQKHMKAAAVIFLNLGREISKIKNKEKRQMALEIFLRDAFHSLTLFIWKILGEAIADYGNDVRNLKNQDLAVQRGKIINWAMHDWISGIADAIAVAMVWNIDILDDAAKQWYQEVRKQAVEYDQELAKLIKQQLKKGEK